MPKRSILRARRRASATKAVSVVEEQRHAAARVRAFFDRAEAEVRRVLAQPEPVDLTLEKKPTQAEREILRHLRLARFVRLFEIPRAQQALANVDRGRQALECGDTAELGCALLDVTAWVHREPLSVVDLENRDRELAAVRDEMQKAEKRRAAVEAGGRASKGPRRRPARERARQVVEDAIRRGEAVDDVVTLSVRAGVSESTMRRALSRLGQSRR